MHLFPQIFNSMSWRQCKHIINMSLAKTQHFAVCVNYFRYWF